MKLIALFFASAWLAAAQTPPDVLDLLRTAAEALSNKEPGDFLDEFDSKMPGYDTLRAEVKELLDRSDVGSSIEIVTDDGGAQKRALELDWLLQVDQDPPRRQLVKVRIERQGRKWKFTSLQPIEFFKP